MSKKPGKACSTCGVSKPLNEFHKDKGSKDGHSHSCKACACERAKQWNRDNKARVAEYNKWRREGPKREETLQRKRDYYWRSKAFKLGKELEQVQQRTMMSSESEFAYWAGYFDADGCVAATSRQGKMQFFIKLVSTDRERMDEIERVFGGGGRVYKQATDTSRTAYVWRSSGKPGSRFVNATLPYLRTKKFQAESFLKAKSTYGFGVGSVTEEVKRARHALVKLVQSLNRREDYFNDS